ncbi:MAG: dTDP-glucose 4,6-dehydratase [Chlamydiota bacterium]
MDTFSPKSMLITGAAGFIGANFVRLMQKRYPHTTLVSYDKLTYAGNLDNLASTLDVDNHHFIQGDIADAEKVSQTLQAYQIDTVVHFAAESHVDNSIIQPQCFIETNVLGTFVLLEQARRYWQEHCGWDASRCRFHHVSTDEVYGMLNKQDPAFTETTAYAPSSPYSASKAGADHLVRAYYHTYNLPITLSNCSNNYGPYQHSEKLIPVVIQNCLKRQAIPVYGDGSNIRDWLYVEDHCDAIDTIINRGAVGQVYNVGGNNEVDNLTLIRTICGLMDTYRPKNAPHQDLMQFVTDRKGHDWRYAIDNRKIQEELQWQPRQDFQKMLRRTIEFYLR